MGLDSGWIEAICGPMFSGKSEELLRRLRRAIIAHTPVQVFTPAMDTRFAESCVVTHDNARMPSEAADSAAEILAKLHPSTRVVGIDEANFFGAPLVAVADRLANSGRQVIVAGLDTDYLGRPFPPMPDLMAIAESITKLLAVCKRCGNQAKHSQRLVQSEDLILLGASDAYEARCRSCFDPASSKQLTGAGSELPPVMKPRGTLGRP